MSTGDDFVEERVDGDFLVGGPSGVGKGDASRSVILVGVDGASGNIDFACVSLCILKDSADGFFSSREDGIVGVVLTGVIVLPDHVGDAVLNGLDNMSHSDSFVDASHVFFELFIGEVAFRDKELECPGNDVVGVDVIVDDLGGELLGREAGGGHAGCARESSSCCC